MILRVVLVLVAFAYLLAFALMRAASLADRRLEAMRRKPKVYDWEERHDFDAS